MGHHYKVVHRVNFLRPCYTRFFNNYKTSHKVLMPKMYLNLQTSRPKQGALYWGMSSFLYKVATLTNPLTTISLRKLTMTLTINYKVSQPIAGLCTQWCYTGDAKISSRNYVPLQKKHRISLDIDLWVFMPCNINGINWHFGVTCSLHLHFYSQISIPY